MVSSFSVNGVTYNVIHRAASQQVNIGTVAGVGAVFDCVVQSPTGDIYPFIVHYPFTRGSGINNDNQARDVEMVKEAFTSDPQGVKPNTTYDINAKSAPYDAIIAKMP